MPRYVAIVPAAGSSSRFQGDLTGSSECPSSKNPNSENSISGNTESEKTGGKLSCELLPGLSVFAASIGALQRLEGLEAIVVPCREADEREFLSQIQSSSIDSDKPLPPVLFVRGGETRTESVAAGLQHESIDMADFVLVHDAARPCLSQDDLVRVVEAAKLSGAAILCAPVNSTLKRGGLGGPVVETLDRSEVFAAQTPQVFRKEILREAYKKTFRQAVSATDEAMLVEKLGSPVTLVGGSSDNIKVTRSVDLALARLLISESLRLGASRS